MTAGRRRPPGTRACAPPTTSSPAPRTIAAPSRSIPLSDGPRDISFAPAGVGARAPAADQADAAHGRSHRSAAGDLALPRLRRTMSNWCGSPTASISATAAISSKAWRRSSDTRPHDHRGRRRRRRRARSPPPTTRPAALTVKVLRASAGSAREPARCARSTSRGCRSAKRRSRSRQPSARPRREFDLPVEIRNDIARIEIAGERSAGAVQLLDKRWRRRTVGVVSGATADTVAAAAVVELLYQRARSARSPTCGSPKASRPPRPCSQFLDQQLPMLILADVGNVAGDAHERLAQLDRGRRRAGALRRAAPRGVRRRSRAGQAAPRRPHSRRQPELGQAATAGRVFARRVRSTACRCPTT